MIKQEPQKLIALPPFELGNGINGRLLRKKDGRIDLVILIEDDTTIENIRKTWEAIDRVRQVLREFQGSDMQNLRNSSIYGYANMKANGWSYGAIAMDINYDCLVNLCRSLLGSFDTENSKVDLVAFSDALFLLDCMGMKRENILGYLIPALRDIREGRSPWSLESGPVDEQRVKDALRQWERQQNKRKVVVKAAPKTEMRSTTELARTVQAENEMAKKLLDKTHPGSWEKYQNLVQKILLEHGYSGVIG